MKKLEKSFEKAMKKQKLHKFPVMLSVWRILISYCGFVAVSFLIAFLR